jgi:hypothetical protein
METTNARTVKEAHGAYCATCDQVFNVATCPYWHWSKSKAMHEYGTGHKVQMFKVVAK